MSDPPQAGTIERKRSANTITSVAYNLLLNTNYELCQYIEQNEFAERFGNHSEKRQKMAALCCLEVVSAEPFLPRRCATRRESKRRGTERAGDVGEGAFFA